MAEPARKRRPASATQLALSREIERVARLHAERRGNPILAGALDRIALWQSRRLRLTYADLAAQERYADAITFFEADLYGNADYTQRDADLERVSPIIVRALPERVVSTIGYAMELNGITQELDRSLLKRLPRADGNFSVAEYSRAFRKMGNREARERQIRLIAYVGSALNSYVERPLIRTALLMMRQPARIAGFTALQEFLERGFAAFRKMDGADEFLATIVRRETHLMEAMFAGEAAPFPDPFGAVIRPPASARAPAAAAPVSEEKD